MIFSSSNFESYDPLNPLFRLNQTKSESWVFRWQFYPSPSSTLIILFLSFHFKVKTGLYTIVVATKCNWSEFYGGNIINEDLVIEPEKKVILPTINAHLNNLWCSEWSGLRGHRQTKYWFTKPDPILATKLGKAHLKIKIKHIWSSGPTGGGGLPKYQPP